MEEKKWVWVCNQPCHGDCGSNGVICCNCGQWADPDTVEDESILTGWEEA